MSTTEEIVVEIREDGHAQVRMSESPRKMIVIVYQGEVMGVPARGLTDDQAKKMERAVMTSCTITSGIFKRMFDQYTDSVRLKVDTPCKAE